jgi:hypothetical protein
MPTATTSTRKLPIPALIIAVISIAILATGAFYLSRPAPAPPDEGGATANAKAYLSNLELSNVDMQATENFMKQQVVEVQGNIANHGARKLALIEVYCLFFGADGKEIYRERLPIVRGLGPQETRSFRLPFDGLPERWNQAMPKLVIAKISFAS